MWGRLSSLPVRTVNHGRLESLPHENSEYLLRPILIPEFLEDTAGVSLS